MTLKLSIGYKTAWGESLVLCLGGKSVPMTYINDALWGCEVSVKDASALSLYHYEVVRDGATVRKEWKGHSLKSIPDVGTVTINDMWHDRPLDSPFWSSAFTDAIFARKPSKAPKAPKGANLLIQVAAPALRPGEVLALAGSGKSLKNWTKVVPFDDSSFPVWTLQLAVNEPFAYKILIADKQTLEPIQWEIGSDRWFSSVPGKGEFRVESDLTPSFAARRWKGAGTAVPVFSLRSEDDFGVGEFYDLKKMVDWASATGQTILQLLPINDTTMLGTWEDSYPYNPNSTFALHPQYINLPAAGVKVDKEYLSLQAELNSLPQIDYERVNNSKLALLKKAFARTYKKLSEK